MRDKAIERAKRWRQENLERARETQRRARRNPERKRRERDGHLRRTFGITIEQYEEMLAAQNGVCAICFRPPTPGISLHVDHDHATGQVRGIACWLCNNAIGDLGDDPARARRLADYIEAADPEVQCLAEIARERVRALRRAQPRQQELFLSSR